jgi:hypothetical protein
MLGTLESHRRRGAAGLHLAWANEISDREGLVGFTEASTIATPLYEKFGYERVEAGEIICRVFDGSDYISTCVFREPRK